MSASDGSAREAILAAVKAALPPAVPRPDPLWPAARVGSGVSRVDAFVEAATAAGAVVTTCPAEDVPRILTAAVNGARSILSYVDAVPTTVAIQDDPHGLDALDLVICEASLGVAENGAVWIATSDTVKRAALFLAARVVIVVAEEHLVDDLHQAYGHLDIRAESFGAFIAGPSKTADIEQSLVIGAHGPKELTLILARSAPPTTHQSE